MRIGFGLVGLLVTVGAIIMIMHYVELPHTQAVLNAGQKAQNDIQQISGLDDQGAPIEETYSLTAENRSDGRLQDLLVANLTAGSPMEKSFGLKANDQIVAAVDSHGFRTDMKDSTDETMAKLAVRDAYTGKGQLVVKRGTSTLVLSWGKAAAPAPGSSAVPPVTGDRSPGAAPAPSQQDNPTGNGGENDTMKAIRDRIHP